MRFKPFSCIIGRWSAVIFIGRICGTPSRFHGAPFAASKVSCLAYLWLSSFNSHQKAILFLYGMFTLPIPLPTQIIFPVRRNLLLFHDEGGPLLNEAFQHCPMYTLPAQVPLPRCRSGTDFSLILSILCIHVSAVVHVFPHRLSPSPAASRSCLSPAAAPPDQTHRFPP